MVGMGEWPGTPWVPRVVACALSGAAQRRKIIAMGVNRCKPMEKAPNRIVGVPEGAAPAAFIGGKTPKTGQCPTPGLAVIAIPYRRYMYVCSVYQRKLPRRSSAFVSHWKDFLATV
jgi:hypothetical protein